MQPDTKGRAGHWPVWLGVGLVVLLAVTPSLTQPKPGADKDTAVGKSSYDQISPVLLGQFDRYQSFSQEFRLNGKTQLCPVAQADGQHDDASQGLTECQRGGAGSEKILSRLLRFSLLKTG